MPISCVLSFSVARSLSLSVSISLSLSHTQTPLPFLFLHSVAFKRLQKQFYQSLVECLCEWGGRWGLPYNKNKYFKKLFIKESSLPHTCFLKSSTLPPKLQVPLSRVLMLSSTKRHFSVDPSLSYLRVFNFATRRLFHFILKRDDGK